MAVYTHLDNAAVRALLSGFDIGGLHSFEGIAEGVENTNYKLNTSMGTYILTLFEKRVNADDLPFYIDFMAHLRHKGVSCAEVIEDIHRKKIVQAGGKAAIITSFLNGTWPRDITPRHCAEIGNLLADMHTAAESFKPARENNMGFDTWEKLIVASNTRADTVSPGLAAFLREEIAFLKAAMPEGLPRGVVHADLFPDNVFFEGQKLSGVIDFYFACTDYFLYDLMLTLNPWCFGKDGALDKEKSSALLNAYTEKRPLSQMERSFLPRFGRMAALRIIATRLYDWLHPVAGAVVKAKDPMEHVRILKYHQHVTSAADYGLSP